MENIGHVVDQILGHQLLDDFDPQAVDVHGAARHKMFHIADELCRAGGVDAIPRHLAGEMFHGLAAGRADLGQLERPLGACPDVHHRANDVGDDVTGALDQHPVTNADVLFGNVIKVMQGSLLDHHPADLDRLQHGVGGQHSRSTNLYTDIVQACGNLPGWKFKGNGTAWVFPDKPQGVGGIQIVQLDDHTIDLERTWNHVVRPNRPEP